MAGFEHPTNDEETLAAPPLTGDAATDTAATDATLDSATEAPTLGRKTLIELIQGKLGLTRLGHYVLLEKLGEGGMGVVFAAYDETLDRKVAIKLLRSEGETAQSRLVREAQAMARLSHPNVTQIYEIGQRGDLTFIVMEFIDGRTLNAWREQEQPEGGEILAVFKAAGRGLAAAHAKGLVHRDFKPENVMIRRDGRVVVMDFGLAREGALGEGSGQLPLDLKALRAAAGKDGATSELSVDITAAGALMGTPAYMAPEQFTGESTSARSDQFSFCVALWEALAKQRPFPGSGLADLALSVTQGERREAPAELPSWIAPVLARGLSVAPDERWPSMDALLAALDADPTRRRRLRLAGLAAIALVVAAVAGAGLLQRRAEQATRASCSAEARDIEAAWSPPIRDELAARFEGATAREAWSHAADWMDDYATDWAGLRERSCLETRVEERRAPAEYAKIAACLDDSRDAAQALVEVWREGDEGVVMQAATAAAGLPPVSLCENEAWLAQRRAGPADPAARERVAELRRRLARVEALVGIADFDGAMDQAKAVLAEAEELGWAPLEAEARLWVGRIQIARGELREAPLTLERAGLDATGAAHDTVALRAAIELTSLVGYQLAEHDRGRYWSRYAAKLLERLGLEGTIYEAQLRSATADLMWASSEFEASLASYREARALYERVLGPEHPTVANQINNIGYLETDLGHYDRAIALYDEALALNRAALGPKHPAVAETLTYKGNALNLQGRYAEAITAHRKAVEIYEAALGPDHPRVAAALNSLGSALSGDHQPSEALAAYERAVALTIQSVGPDHPSVATGYNNLGTLLMAMEEFGKARAKLEQARDILAAAGYDDKRNMAIIRLNLGTALLNLGDPEGALVEAEAGHALFVDLLGEDHPHVGGSFSMLARTRVALGDYEQARADLDRALAILEPKGPPLRLAAARLNEARLLAATGERAAAQELLETLLETLRELGEEDSKEAKAASELLAGLADPQG